MMRKEDRNMSDKILIAKTAVHEISNASIDARVNGNPKHMHRHRDELESLIKQIRHVMEYLTIAVLIMTVGCVSTTRGRLDSTANAINHPIASMAIRLATTELLEGSSKPKERALEILAISEKVRKALEDPAATAVFSEFRFELAEKIKWYDMTPTERILIHSLLDLIEHEIKIRIADEKIDPSAALIVSSVLDAIDMAATHYLTREE